MYIYIVDIDFKIFSELESLIYNKHKKKNIIFLFIGLINLIQQTCKKLNFCAY